MSSTPNNILIKNIRVIDPYQNFDGSGDIFISDGRIVTCPIQTAENKTADFSTKKIDKEIDGKGKVLFPSLIDTNVHLREPGFQRKASMQSELKAAASAGIGHLACLPTCEPTIDTASLAKSIIEKSNGFGLSKVYPIGALTKGLQGTQLSEMKSLADADCVALTNFYQPIQSLSVLRRCYEYAATFDIPVFIYPLMHELAQKACAHEGYWSAKLGLPGIPESAETIAIAMHLILIEQTGVRAHFSQLSCAKSVLQIAAAKEKSMNITADVAAHQLFLDDSYLENYDSQYHLCPPLRTKDDARALIAGLKNGTIDAICSSHQPHEAAAKRLPFQSSETGISALETLLPLAGKLTQVGFSLLDLARVLCQNPGQVLGIKRAGIQVGELADFCIFSDNDEWQLKENQLFSSGKNTPFINEHFLFKNHFTFVNGRLIFSND